MGHDLLKTLFVTGCIPFELSRDTHGVFQRMRMMLQSAEAASNNIQALFLAATEKAEDPENLEQVNEWLKKQLGSKIDVQILKVQFRPSRTNYLPFRMGAYFGHSPLRTLTKESIDSLSKHVSSLNPNLIVAHRIETFRAIRLASPDSEIPIIFDLDDIEHLAFARSVLSPPHYRSKLIRLAHVPPLLVEELKALRKCQQIYVCSDIDNAKLKHWGFNSSVVTIPNGVTKPIISNKVLSRASSPEVLFVGMLEYPPNAIGIDWFLKNVWPLVSSKSPAARLKIIGKGGGQLSIPHSVRSSVIVHGFVDSLAEMYARSHVAICPLLSGGGTRIKIIEAASHRTPMVSTHVGAEGLAFEDGRSIKLADSPVDFANAVVDIITNPNLSREMGNSAYSVFESLYDRETIMTKIIRTMKEVPTK